MKSKSQKIILNNFYNITREIISQFGNAGYSEVSKQIDMKLAIIDNIIKNINDFTTNEKLRHKISHKAWENVRQCVHYKIKNQFNGINTAICAEAWQRKPFTKN